MARNPKKINIESPENAGSAASEKAKAELEKRIAEKLSMMSETDLEELFMLHEQQLKVKKNSARSSGIRRGSLIEGQISFNEVKDGDRYGDAKVIEFPSRQSVEAGKKFFAKLFSPFIKAARKITSKLPSFSDILPERPRKEDKKKRQIRYLLLKYNRRLRKKEKKASLIMANFISIVDKGNDALAKITVEIVKRIDWAIYSARDRADTHKKKLLAGLVVVITVAVASVSTVNYFSAYVYAYNGRPLGMVKNQEDVLRVLEVVSEQLTREYGASVRIDENVNITFERVYTANQEIDDMQEVFNRLTYMQDINVRGQALFVDNERIAVFDTRETIENLLEDFTQVYLKEPHMDLTYEEVKFAEKIDIRPIDTRLGMIENPAEILDRILTGAVERRIHIVERGETFSGIAKKYNMTMPELEASNPGITPARLAVAQEIVLQQSVPLITVQTIEVSTYADVLPFETIYEDSAAIFKGEQTTRVRGVNGEREVTARIIRNNGIEVERVELSSTIIKEASTAVVLRGTKDPPPQQGTGRLIYPVNGARRSSNFGMRGGRMHYGVDLAIAHGTRIGAADGGTVTFAGYNGSFGYLIIIDHGANMQTYYAHCSVLHVKRGDKVFQGQHIANVGSTGRSSGPHLHFEVHVNGVARNPLNYLNR